MKTISAPDLRGKDAIWASVKVAMPADDLYRFCQDLERLFRINPYLEIDAWKVDANRYQVSGRNNSQLPPFQFNYEFTLSETPLQQLLLTYTGDSLKATTCITIEPLQHDSVLSITDDYGKLPESERQRRLAEVDQSLVKWLTEIQRFLVVWQRWSRFSLWRWYMRYIWQPMKPSGRRVVYMLLWITLVEIVLIALGAGFYMTM